MSKPTTQSSGPLLVPLAHHQQATAAQQALIDEAVAQVAATADLHPGVTIVHSLLTDSVEYMSTRGLLLLKTTLPEIKALGAAYHAVYFNAEDAKDFVPKVYEMIMSSDAHTVVSTFQQVRTTENPEYTWYFSSTRLLLRDPNGTPLLIITSACPVDPLHHVTHKVSRLLEENNFLRGHATRYGQLTPREREVLRGMVLGQSAHELAGKLFVSPQTVETHRRNLRRKLGEQNTFELAKYARAFDLV